MNENVYVPFSSKIQKVIRHTSIEYTFRMEYHGNVKPGQFFEVSMPKYGEAPISVSGIGEDYVDLTIRRVGKVTNEIFEKYLMEMVLWFRIMQAVNWLSLLEVQEYLLFVELSLTLETILRNIME